MTAAFWLKASWNGKWYFYVVSPVADAEGIGPAYERLHPLVRAGSDSFGIDPLEIRLIGPNNPMARDVLAALAQARGPRDHPIRWRGTILADLSVEEAYLYPVPAAVP